MFSYKFVESTEILHHCWTSKDAIVQLLRLVPNMKLLPNHLSTNKRCLITFRYFGRAYGSIIMPLKLHVFTQIWGVG